MRTGSRVGIFALCFGVFVVLQQLRTLVEAASQKLATLRPDK